MTGRPDSRFAVVPLDPDENGRPRWGLRDRITGALATCGDNETAAFYTPDSARAHRHTYLAIARRAEDVA
ncbi:hypothetical protein ACIA8O_37015 [Kitasatospora sp. NPDC051853]|uniref:hypothetical protein n=1 Tax=Kitasatospora sp. NPDC051853 TaxID=3364058 RepID=UPI0037B977DB